MASIVKRSNPIKFYQLEANNTMEFSKQFFLNTSYDDVYYESIQGVEIFQSRNKFVMHCLDTKTVCKIGKSVKFWITFIHG